MNRDAPLFLGRFSVVTTTAELKGVARDHLVVDAARFSVVTTTAELKGASRPGGRAGLARFLRGHDHGRIEG